LRTGGYYFSIEMSRRRSWFPEKDNTNVAQGYSCIAVGGRCRRAILLCAAPPRQSTNCGTLASCILRSSGAEYRGIS
jgi:hypothetical protein